MRVIVGCEFTGTVRDAFRARGHEAYSCDLSPTEREPQFHWQGDIMTAPYLETFDLGIFFPTCTFLCVSGAHWTGKPGHENRAQLTEDALTFVRTLMKLPIKRIAIENPIGFIGSRIRKADQIFQPYEFGDDASKRTCLWLKNLPPLIPTTRFNGRMVEWPIGSGKLIERWSNQTDSGQNRLGPSETRAMDRSRTYPGPAAAMADQWGSLVL